MAENVLRVLRAIPKETRETRNDFVWPESGPVECPDWIPNQKSGNGLHGWLYTPAANKSAMPSYEGELEWLVVEVSPGDLIDLGDKVKFRAGNVIYSGNFETASRMAQPSPNVAGFDGTATAGYRGTATAGNRGTATAGDDGTATAGDRGTATAGDDGTATAGDDGTATAGNRGTATAGYRGTATAGYRGTATAGDCGMAKAGDGGVLILQDLLTKLVARVGHDGIEPNVFYKIQDGKFVKVLEGSANA